MPLTLRQDNPTGPDAVITVEIEWCCFGGSERPRGFPLRREITTAV
jgi:hypothetical protein